MGEAWFTGVADELARCLVDARGCAEAGEALLESVATLSDAAARRTVLDALVAPIAVSRVLIELIDDPPQLALAAARLLADSADAGAMALATLGDDVDGAAAIAGLRTVAESSRRLIDAAV